MGCNCEPKKYSVSMGCCQPVLGPIEAYYTKFQIDKMLEEIESGITSGCCITPEEVESAITSAMTIVEGEIPSLSGYATEQWVEDKHYITGVDLSDYALKSEIPTVPTSNTAFTNDAGYLTEHQSLSGYATEQWVEDKHYITGVDLSDYVTYESLPDLSVYATKQWVINQNFALNTELIQYITNLQNQIDSLKQQISGCCGSTGETITRWITMTGENDYTCSGTTKMTKEKEQTSTDGGNTWSDTGNYRTGSTVLEVNSVDCGYVPPVPIGFKYKLTLDDSSIVTAQCDSTSAITRDEVSSYLTTCVNIEVGDCVTEISGCTTGTCGAFASFRKLSSVTISNSVTSIGDYAFKDCSGLTSINIPSGVTNIGSQAFYNCVGITSLVIPDSLTTIGSFSFTHCGLTSLTIGTGLTSIANGAFADTDLQNVLIQSNVSSIGWGAFEDCTALTSVTVEATTPPSLDAQAFDNSTCPIYVPAASVETYKATSGWSEYASRIQAIP